MKLAGEKETKVELIKECVIILEKYIVFTYLFCMLGIFPLYYKEQYYKIGDAKFGFFWNVSVYFIVSFLIMGFIKLVLGQATQKSNSANLLWKFLDNLSALDYAVFIYTICVMLSYTFSDFKYYAFRGAAGWEMGLCSQMIFVAIYFILSRQNIFENVFLSTQAAGRVSSISGQNKWTDSCFLKQKRIASVILGIHLITSGLTFVFGILHRFDIDPLGMYPGLNLYQKIEFLSTIGQATWFSSYVCTTFVIGVTVFYISEKTWVRMVTGIYSVISFGILVTQNSDSAFMAIAGILLLLGYFSLNNIEKWCRFWQVMGLMWGTFGGIGILQVVFADRAIPLDSLSVFFSQSGMTWVFFVVSFGMLFFYSNYINKKREDSNRVMYITQKIYKGMLVFIVVVIIATIIFIYLNTKGYLLHWFGYQSTNQYLLFDYHWGSNRGSTWMVCWQGFKELPWFQKLFGVGPDSVSAYLYSIPEVSDFLHSLWGSERLTNAHNEYLNSLLCYGVVGATSWLAVLIGGILYFYQKAKENPFMIAFALCIVGYACHNIFCYQQVCCTPFLFIALGIGESIASCGLSGEGLKSNKKA